MSRALERLREMFGDPLLVRSGRTYERTVRGERVLRELETLVPRLDAMVGGVYFDPARSQERFRVALTDHASTILLPSLVARIKRAASHVTVEVSAWHTQGYEDVAAGRIDTALSAEEAPPVLESEVLFNFDSVCLVGSALRVRAHRFTLKQYLQLPHALVETLAGQQTLVDRPRGIASRDPCLSVFHGLASATQLNLLTLGSVNNCGWLLGRFEPSERQDTVRLSVLTPTRAPAREACSCLRQTRPAMIPRVLAHYGGIGCRVRLKCVSA